MAWITRWGLVKGGSDTTQKVALVATGGLGSTLMGALWSHGVTGLMTVAGAKMGPWGALIGNKIGAGLATLKSAGVRQTGDLVKEAMLNPALANVLLERLTPATEQATASRALAVLSRLTAKQGAHTAGAAQRFLYPAASATPANTLAGLGNFQPPAPPPRAGNVLSGLGAR